MPENTNDIMATSAVRSQYRRMQAEEQVERQKDQQGREVSKRYSDLKHELDNSSPQQIMREGLKSLDNYYDNKTLTDDSLTNDQIADHVKTRRTLRAIEGIYVKMDVKGAIADNTLRKELDLLKETLDKNLD